MSIVKVIKTFVKRASIVFFGCVVLVGAVIVWSNRLIVSSTSEYIVDHASDLPEGIDFQTVITPGAAVYADWRLSSITRWRVMSAKELLDTGAVPTILISWDNWTEEYNEVRAMRNYIVWKWVSKDVIFQDFAWFDTFDTIYRARDIFQVERAVVTTQAFHLNRAVYIARNLWIEARWVKAWGYQPRWRDKMMFREYLARVKARWEVMLWSSPKFLGESVDIEGESNWWVG